MLSIEEYLWPDRSEDKAQGHIWDELRDKHFHNRIFVNLDALEDQTMQALKVFEEDLQRMRSIASWDWIIHSFLMSNKITAVTVELGNSNEKIECRIIAKGNQSK